MPPCPSEDPDPVLRPRVSDAVLHKLQHDLEAGLWMRELPGIRKLMQRYGVSGLSVQQALEALEGQGYIGPAVAGSCRAILRAPTTADCGELIVCSPPPEDMLYVSTEVYRQVTTALTKACIPWRGITLIEKRSAKFSSELRALVRSTPNLRGIIVIQKGHTVIRRAVGAKIPLLIHGSREREDSRSTAVYINLSDVLPHAVGELCQRDFANMTLISTGLPRAMYNNLLPKIASAFAHHGVRFVKERHFPWIKVGELSPALRSIMQNFRPRILLTIGERQWPRVLWEVQRMQIETEVIALWPSKIFDAFENPPCLFEIKIEEAAKKALKWFAEISVGKTPHFTHHIGMKSIWKSDR